jgi:surface carbohydrate biosynthesis protein (TIGR04326 family)
MYAAPLANYPDLQVDEITEALHRVLADFDVVLTTHQTCASLDAYLAGLSVVIFLDCGNLNLSPLRGYPDVCFVSTPEELAEAIQNASQNKANRPISKDFFFLEPELTRWKQLLSSIDSV